MYNITKWMGKLQNRTFLGGKELFGKWGILFGIFEVAFTCILKQPKCTYYCQHIPVDNKNIA